MQIWLPRGNGSVAVTARKDDPPAAGQAAITKVAAVMRRRIR